MQQVGFRRLQPSAPRGDRWSAIPFSSGIGAAQQAHCKHRALARSSAHSSLAGLVGSTDLNSPVDGYLKQSQVAVGGLIGKSFGPVILQTYLTDRIENLKAAFANYFGDIQAFRIGFHPT